MRVLRGRAGTIADDRAASMATLDRVAESGEPAVRVWRPHRQVAFGRRDAREEGYDRARAAASDHGFDPVERDVGGRAVAYTGRTLAFARVEPVEDVREGLDDRYERATADLRRALADLDVDATRGEPENAFCPGTHSLQADGKLAGIAQRVQQGAAVVAGVLVVADRDPVAAVLSDVYSALGVPLDPSSVGSVAAAGGPADPERVREIVEAALVGDADTTVDRVDDLT
jgi:octanoyl-[GcvH]:protein N-octanoyltransferase